MARGDETMGMRRGVEERAGKEKLLRRAEEGLSSLVLLLLTTACGLKIHLYSFSPLPLPTPFFQLSDMAR